MKTSARNVFQGQIVSLKEYGILVEVMLETATGLKVIALITQPSKKSLGLNEGKMINAMVKAPWVTVVPQGNRGAAPAENCFIGKVEKVEKDALACEIIVALADGKQLCALYANGASPDAGIVPGAEVAASFSAFSVILTEE